MQESQHNLEPPIESFTRYRHRAMRRKLTPPEALTARLQGTSVILFVAVDFYALAGFEFDLGEVGLHDFRCDFEDQSFGVSRCGINHHEKAILLLGDDGQGGGGTHLPANVELPDFRAEAGPILHEHNG